MALTMDPSIANGKGHFSGALPSPYSRLSPAARRVLDLLLQREIALDQGDGDAVRWMEDELKTIRAQDPDAFVQGADEAYQIIGYVERFSDLVALHAKEG